MILIKYIHKYIDTLDVSEKTKQAHRQMAHWLFTYMSETGETVNFNNIDKGFYLRYKKYLLENKKYSENTFGKHIKNLKSFMRWGYVNGLHKNTAFMKYKVLNKACVEDALHSEEIKKIWEIDLEDRKRIVDFIQEFDRTRLDWRQQEMRYQNFLKHFDMLIALCSSGCYPRDLLTLSKDNIIDGRFFKYKRTKTVNGFQEPWSIFPYEDDDVFHFKTVFERQNFSFKFVYRSFTRDIRIILALADIHKSVTPRSFRKSFASIWYYERNLDLQTCMKLTGHSKESSFKHYLNIDDEVIMNKVIAHKTIYRDNEKSPLKLLS